MDEIDAAIKVAEARGVGPRRAACLREACGSFQEVYGSTAAELSDILGLDQRRAKILRNSIRTSTLRAHRLRAKRQGVVPIALGQSHFPPLLSHIGDPPTVLWVKGDLRALHEPCTAVVGARRCSPDAPGIVGEFSLALCGAGWSIVSGGARGVDAAAHRMALQCGVPTVVVMGSGIDCVYPPEHEELFAEVIEKGGVLVSEYPCGTSPRAGYFPARNRIIAGMSVGVLMIEAGDRSGALITGRLAAEDYGREVMAVPGSVLDGRSDGSHRAIREGWAGLVEVPDHAIEQLRESGGLLAELGIHTKFNST